MPGNPDRLVLAGNHGLSLVDVVRDGTVTATQIAASGRSGPIAATPDGTQILVRVVGQHLRADDNEFVDAMNPHTRDDVRFTVAALVDGRWRHSLSRWVRLSSDSTAGLKLKGAREVVGYKFRVMVTFYGDQENTESSSRYRYFKFVR